MKKDLIPSILTTLTKWVPIAVYGCFNIENLYSTSDKGITVSAIVILGAILLYFKDALKDWLASPSTFKYVCILWVLALIFVVLGNQIFEITSILLASFLAAIPLDVWRKHVKDEMLDDETTKKLKELLKK